MIPDKLKIIITNQHLTSTSIINNQSKNQINKIQNMSTITVMNIAELKNHPINDQIYTGSVSNPIFRDIYAPVDGFVVNGGIKIKL